MLRALFVSAIILFGVTQALRGPFYALLFYLWFAYFRPETWVWGDFVSDLNISFIVGVYVLLRTLFSGEKLRFGTGPVLMLVFLAQSLISTTLSPAFAYSWEYFTDFAKSTVISVLIVTLVTTEKRLRLTLLIIAISLGFEATKQGWAQFFLNPGGQNINGSVMLGDNNGVAIGMFMLVPIVIALARTASTKAERYGLRFVAFGTFYRGIVTYSRGGFLACAALSLHYILRSKRKLSALVAAGIVAAIIVPVLPEAFWTRMNSIPENTDELDGTTDGAIIGRLHFWRVAVVMANDRPLIGIGHNAYNQMYDRYDFSNGRYKRRRSVHSVWFGLAAELGYPGLLLFIAILAHAFWQCSRVRRLAKDRPELQNLALYAAAIEAGLVSVAVGGSFVIYQYCEFLWHAIALSIAIGRLAAKEYLVPVANVAAPHGISAARIPATIAVARQIKAQSPLTP